MSIWTVLFVVCALQTYLLICVIAHNRRLEKLEDKERIVNRAIQLLYTKDLLTVNEARQLQRRWDDLRRINGN